MGHHLTMNDIARRARVSVATVSRVLAGSPKVRDETRQRVLGIVRAEQYEPSQIARSLSTRKTHTVGVVIDDIANPFFMELAKGVETVVREKGYTMLLTSSDWDEEREGELLRTLVRNRVDGALIAAVSPDSGSTPLLRRAGIPFVLMNCWSPDDSVSYVAGDSVAGGRLAAECLLQTKVRQFLCLVGVPHQSSEERAKGFAAAIHAAGRGEALRVHRDVRTFEDGYRIVRRLLALHRIDSIETGIFTSNDFVAMGVVDALLDHRIRVPEQVSVIGYDNIGFAERYRVPLTTVDQPKQTMGELAAAELIRSIEEHDYRGKKLMLKPRLVVRETCRSPIEATELSYTR